jgi:hypothetical protein
MTKAIPVPFTSKEVVSNCQALIAAGADKRVFENMAKSIITQASDSQNSPGTLRNKLGALRKELNNAFKDMTAYKSEGKPGIFILSEMLLNIENATGIQDGNATRDDYPRILENIQVYVGGKTGEIILRAAMVEEAPTVTSTETPVTIDAAKFIALAAKQIKSDEWTDIAIGIAMATARRETEVCAAMSFEAKDEYTLVISEPCKKRGSSSHYYEIPCLLPADDIEEAVERMRAMVNFERFDIQRRLGNLVQANKEFNNCYKQPLLNRYNEFMRTNLETYASVDGKNNFHKLRDLSTSIWKQAKRDSYGHYSPKYENQVLRFTSGVLVHAGTGATASYGNWDVSNVPQYVVGLTNRSYGNVIKKVEQSTSLVSLEPEEHNALLASVSPKPARGVVGSERISLIISAMFQHNGDSEHKVFVCESQVTAAYTYIYGEQVSFNLVRKIFTDLGTTVADHNAYKGLSVASNLKLRGAKIKAVYESLKQIISNGL